MESANLAHNRLTTFVLHWLASVTKPVRNQVVANLYLSPGFKPIHLKSVH